MGDAVERYGLDWLKWDNSGLPGPVCNRADHGHQATDGALAALKGQYEIWEYLHGRFPKLMLEECGYPSRLDYGLARNVQAHWLADSTQPALHVRQNQLHASYVFPAAHNEAWVIRCGEIEGAKDPALLDTLVRSRMVGLFGIGTLTGKLTERASLYPQGSPRRPEAEYRCLQTIPASSAGRRLPHPSSVDPGRRLGCHPVLQTRWQRIRADRLPKQQPRRGKDVAFAWFNGRRNL